MLKTLILVFTITGFLAAYTFDVWNLQSYLEGSSQSYKFEFPPVTIPDYILAGLVLVTSVFTLVFLVFLIPDVKISKLKLASSAKFGPWYGVNIKRRGFECECTAEARIAWPDQKIEPIQLALRTRNQWEQADIRSEGIAPFHLRQIPKFLPMFMIKKNESNKPHIFGLDQTEEQWRLFRQGCYRVEVYISHGSIFWARKRFYIRFDGEDIKQIRWFEYWRYRRKYLKELARKIAAASTPSTPHTSAASQHIDPPTHSGE